MKKFLFLLILVVLISLCTGTEEPSEYKKYCSEDQHHGRSTNGTCSIDSDCVIDGCNGEICRSESEGGMESICIYNPPYPKDLGCECKCVNEKCMWVK